MIIITDNGNEFKSVLIELRNTNSMPWGKQYSAIYLYLILRTRKEESIWDSSFFSFFLNIKFERRLEKKSEVNDLYLFFT